MSVPVFAAGITIEDWVNAAAGPYERVEISNGEFVFRRIGGNPHHFVAPRLAEEFMRQWPEVMATAPGHWALEHTSGGWPASVRGGSEHAAPPGLTSARRVVPQRTA